MIAPVVLLILRMQVAVLGMYLVPGGCSGCKKCKPGFPVIENKREEINSGYWGRTLVKGNPFIGLRVHIQERRTPAKAYRAIETSAIAL